MSPNLNHTYNTPVNLYVVDFKQPFPNNCTIVMLHIIPNRKLNTISFQMAYDVAVFTVGPLNSTKFGFVRFTNKKDLPKNLFCFHRNLCLRNGTELGSDSNHR